MSDDAARCGTVRGYLFHLWSDTWVCLPCEQAHANFSVTRSTASYPPVKKRKFPIPPPGYTYCRTCGLAKKTDEAFAPGELRRPKPKCRPCRAEYDKQRKTKR